jgi:hypothetical protein
MKRTSIAILFIFVAGFVASPALAKTTFISVGTGGTGGIYYPYGGGVAEIWSKYVPVSRPWPRSPAPALKMSSWPTRAKPSSARSWVMWPWPDSRA